MIDLVDEDSVESWDVEGLEMVVTVVDGVVADVTVVVVISLLGAEVEPDVRLRITLPALMGNGAVLPRVLDIHPLLDELPGPQQNVEPSWTGKMVMPLSVRTRRPNM